MKRVFLAPLLIGSMSLVGLVSGLTGDGPADVLAWIGLAVPLLVIAWARRYRSR